jgi:hypothetical protein
MEGIKKGAINCKNTFFRGEKGHEKCGKPHSGTPLRIPAGDSPELP